MTSLYEILLAAQGEAAMEAMAKRLGLPPETARDAVAAVLPAFSLALKRVAGTPEGLRQLMELSGAGPYASYIESAMSAIPPRFNDAGEEVLRTVFQSDGVKAAIAAKAAAEAGVAEAIMRELMPAVASAVMNGLAKEARANPMFAAFFPPAPGADKTGQGASAATDESPPDPRPRFQG